MKVMIFADLHDYNPQPSGTDTYFVLTPNERFERMIEHAKHFQPDVLINLGDLSRDFANEGQQTLEQFQRFPATHKISVIGNHDEDIQTVEQYMDGVGMPSEYYHTDVGNIRYISLFSGLDGMTVPDATQLEWLEGALADAPGKVVLLSHGVSQPYNSTTIWQPVRTLIDQYSAKVLAYFWGHSHRPYMKNENGVWYINVNSVSWRYTVENGMHWYRDPVYLYGEITTSGLSLTGTGVWRDWTGAVDKTLYYPDDNTLQPSVNSDQLGVLPYWGLGINNRGRRWRRRRRTSH